MDANGKSDPYVTLTVGPMAGLSSDALKKQHIKTSPQKTTTKLKTLHPKWNETYTLDVQDIDNYHLEVLVWDEDADDGTVWNEVKSIQRPVGIVSVLRHIKNKVENKPKKDDFIGLATIPLKDVYAENQPLERWWNLRTRLDMLGASAGRIKLQLSLVMIDNKSNDQIITDLYNLIKSIYNYQIKESASLKLTLPAEAKNIVNLFSKRNKIDSITEKFIAVVVALELGVQTNEVQVTDDHIVETFRDLEAEVSQRSSWEVIPTKRRSVTSLLLDQTIIDNEELDQKWTPSLAQIDLLNTAARNYVETLLVNPGRAKGLFFPITIATCPTLISACKVIYKLHALKLDNWSNEFRILLAEKVKIRLKEDFKMWLEKSWQVGSKVPVENVPEIMADASNELIKLTAFASPKPEVLQELPFEEWGVNYLVELSKILDEMLFEPCQALVGGMDQYQERYADFPTNICNSSRTSLKFYMGLKALVSIMRQNINPEEMKLRDYESWFKSSFNYLLESYKNECPRRVSLAMKLEDEHVKEENGVSSVVYVLNCLADVASEWKQLEIENPDVSSSFLIKLTQVIYDTATLYASYIHENVTKNFALLHYQEFFKLVSESITNLTKVEEYLQGLPKEMKWNQNGQTELDQLESSLKRVLKTLETNIKKITRITEESIKPKLEEYLRQWTKTHHQAKDPEKVRGYLNKRFTCLYQQLPRPSFTDVIFIIWNFIIEETRKNFQEGLKPEYAQTILNNVNAVWEDFRKNLLFMEGTERTLETQQYRDLQELLQLHSLSATELQLQYCWELSQSQATPDVYLGRVALHMGYQVVTKGTVTLTVKVLNAKGLPAGENDALRSTMVRVELNPATVFPGFQPYTTAVQRNTLNPVFNETFKFADLPKTVLKVRGGVIHFVLIDWAVDSPAGEVYFPLDRVPDMSKHLGLEYVPAVILPFRHFHGNYATYNVLQQRSEWDEHSKEFLKSRRSLVRKEPKKKGCFSRLAKFKRRFQKKQGGTSSEHQEEQSYM